MVRGWFVCVLAALAPGMAFARAGVDVQVAGGVVAFPGPVAVDPGAAWAVSAGLRPWPWAGVEAGYQGAAYTGEAVRAEESVAAIENGGSAAVRVGPTERPVAPYALAGLGLSHINAVDEGREGGPVQDDMVARVPIGVGVDVRFDVFHLGLRGTYDFVFLNQRALRSPSGRGADQVLGTIRMGATF